jgi:hypothetical protein
MFTDRRTFVGLVGSTIILPSPAWAQIDDEFPPLPPAYGPENRPEFVRGVSLGAETPPAIDREVAQALIARAPFNCAPIDVALYWRGIGQGQIPDLGSSRLQNRAGRHFVRGWPRVYNPVIINFFNATSLDPLRGDGDGTHWCAAFVNWCIARGHATTARIADVRANRGRGTGSASSGSFRCWGQNATAGGPRRGDVVVWATDGTVSGCAIGTGHVAFFLERNADGTIEVVGGNQRDPMANISAVCRKAMPQAYNISRNPAAPRYKRFHSIRTHSVLHG